MWKKNQAKQASFFLGLSASPFFFYESRASESLSLFRSTGGTCYGRETKQSTPSWKW